MAFKFPWSNLHELNLDWILSVVKRFSELVPPMETAVEDVQALQGDVAQAVEDAQSAVTAANQAAETAAEALEVAEQAAAGTIADGAVTTAKLADSAVTNDKIAAGAVTASKLGPGAVTTLSIANGAVTSAKIENGTIIAEDMADGAVTTAKLADNAVTNAKLADDSVNSAEIVAGAVTNAKIADGAVTLVKLAPEAKAVNGSNYVKFPDGTLIQWGSVTGVSFSGTDMKDGTQAFPISFYDTTYRVMATAFTTSVNKYVFRIATSESTTDSFLWTIACNETITIANRGFNWVAFGRWKE